jgi:hypothetical protein
VFVLRRVHLHHFAGKLMPEHHIGRIVDMAAKGMQRPRVIAGPIAKIAAADPTCLNFDKDVLFGCELRFRYIRELEVFWSSQYNCFQSL